MKNFDFSSDANGYYFIYDKSNISQYIARRTKISVLKIHNIIRKHNGFILKDQHKYSAASTYRFETMEECKKAAEELDNLILMKKLVG